MHISVWAMCVAAEGYVLQVLYRMDPLSMSLYYKVERLLVRAQTHIQRIRNEKTTRTHVRLCDDLFRTDAFACTTFRTINLRALAPRERYIISAGRVVYALTSCAHEEHAHATMCVVYWLVNGFSGRSEMHALQHGYAINSPTRDAENVQP